MPAMSDAVAVRIDDLVVPLSPQLLRERIGIDHHLKPHIARHLGIGETAVVGYELEMRSLDARQKPRLCFRYRLTARVSAGSPVREGPGVRVETPGHGDDSLHRLVLDPQRPRQAVVVGTGPAGIMAAYLLALHGVQVLVLDRGRDVERRHADLERFHSTRTIDPDSNYLYGEGGAGTYSDGKLYTRAKDRRLRFLLEAFVAARAPRHILWHHHPHIGSDLLPHMARRLRQNLEAMGGRFRWEARVSDLLIRDGRCAGVVLDNGEQIAADCTIMGFGHSARDLILRLMDLGVGHEPKGFQLGCRIEHPQSIIDHARYGGPMPRHLLTAAEYNLVSRPPTGRGVGSTTTFCMCPGGEIICASSEPGLLCTNGMSRHSRATGLANAGLIVNQPVARGDGSAACRAGLELVEHLERAAYAAGGGDWSCPAQTAAAFLRGEDGPEPRPGSYRLGVRRHRLDALLPPATRDALREALRFFDRQVPGFIREGVLVGVEARVSSPVRFLRDPANLASTLPGLWLAGEGAGYAGGIVSAGLDGLRLAETILTGKPAKREKHAPASDAETDAVLG
jgi:hypothetical protein